MSDIEQEGLALPGLDGTNPLGFLAALGLVSTVAMARGMQSVGVRWQASVDRCFPAVTGFNSVDEVVSALTDALRLGSPPSSNEFYLHLGKNLSIDPNVFREAETRAISESTWDQRSAADAIASFGCSAVVHEKLPRIQPTELHFIFGSGHQHYLETANKLLANCTPEHLKEAIEGPWRYRDEKLSFRWDPEDAREYAYRWADPGGETTRTVWGANVLAFFGVTQMLASVPSSATQLRTMGFTRADRKTFLVWPLWNRFLGISTMQSLLRSSVDDLREHSEERGLTRVLRAEKKKMGDGANYKWAFGQSEPIL
ncbi:hypothetical protein KOR34_53130 [Posidoniimonas corsicana]|uniref:Uncharacterized protein n=1 Tax=Posidoniimonas corsicana TaxID=1938618 RepID=A0A5C5US30_9BACT|nr:hypothetical protein [Posidoniimonas corsicana]TWT29174.1 hypothetical protein KOR34_53130 [Posidoniimonas corsicana]